MSFRPFCAAMAAGLVLFSAAAAAAHGIGYRHSEKKPVSLEFSYSTGEAMSYLDTRVYSPKDEKFAFQSGRTDEAGRFAFTPDVSGLWRVVVRDEEGHMAEASVNVTEDFLKGDGNFLPEIVHGDHIEGAELALRAVLGVSLLFNLAAGVVLRRNKVKK
ncbi:MAG: hypothetical protein FWG71_02755 [Synergistaceae bacterium]|nr:hypothetical protein [Synergistaceae bacterium]